MHQFLLLDRSIVFLERSKNVKRVISRVNTLRRHRSDQVGMTGVHIQTDLQSEQGQPLSASDWRNGQKTWYF